MAKQFPYTQVAGASISQSLGQTSNLSRQQGLLKKLHVNSPTTFALKQTADTFGSANLRSFSGLEGPLNSPPLPHLL